MRLGQQFAKLDVLAVGGHAAPGIKPIRSGAFIRRVSQTAVVSGGVVHVWGIGFGDTPGTLRIGDTAVASAAILVWADNHVAFRATDDLTRGRVRIDGPGGFVSDGRTYHLRRTAPITTPFSTVDVPVVPQRQGIKKLPLAPYQAVLSKIGVHFVDGDDLYRYAATTPEDPGSKSIQINLDDWLGVFTAATAPGMEDALPFTLALNATAPAQDGHPRQLELVGSLLLDLAHGQAWQRRGDGQLIGAAIGPLSPSKGGKSYTPQLHREPDGTFLMVLQAPGDDPMLYHVAGWGADGKLTLVAGGVSQSVDWGLSGAAKVGALVVVIGDGQNGGGGKFSAGWRVSTDGGKTLAELQADKTHPTLAWPVAVAEGANKGVWALELKTQTGPGSLMRFGMDGKPVWGQAPTPFEQLSGAMLWPSGTFLVAWQPASGLQVLDTAKAVGARKWLKIGLPGGAELLNATVDWPSKRLLLTSHDTVFAAALPPSAEGLTVTPVATPTLIAPIDINLRAVGAFADGSLLCDAALSDARPASRGKPSPLLGMVVQVVAP